MGRLSTAPTAAATSAPITMASMTDMPKFVTSCAVANAPIAANDAWQSEMVPPTPVVSTTESRITAKQTPPVTKLNQKSSSTKSATSSPMTAALTPKARVMVVIQGGRSEAAGGGGGGSTPESGSLISWAVREERRNTTSTKSTANGRPGRKPVARMLSVGRKLASSACRMPRPMPPTNAQTMLVRLPMTQAAIAATNSVKKSSESS